MEPVVLASIVTVAGGVLLLLCGAAVKKLCGETHHVVIERQSPPPSGSVVFLDALTAASEGAITSIKKIQFSDQGRTELLACLMTTSVTTIQHTAQDGLAVLVDFEERVPEHTRRSLLASVRGLMGRMRANFTTEGIPDALQTLYESWFSGFVDSTLNLIVLGLNGHMNTQQKVAQTLLSCAVFLIDAVMSQVSNLSLLNGELDGTFFRGFLCDYHAGRDGRSALLAWVKNRDLSTRFCEGFEEEDPPLFLSFQMGVMDPNITGCPCVYRSSKFSTEVEISEIQKKILVCGTDTAFFYKDKTRTYAVRSLVYKAETTETPKKLLLVTSMDSTFTRRHHDILWKKVICASWEFIVAVDPSSFVVTSVLKPYFSNMPTCVPITSGVSAHALYSSCSNDISVAANLNGVCEELRIPSIQIHAKSYSVVWLLIDASLVGIFSDPLGRFSPTTNVSSE